MGLSRTNDIMDDAVDRGVGVGAFNVISLESAEAIVRGAERAGTPVVMQISENCIRHHGAADPVVVATLALARSAGVPVAVHLDHVESPDLVREGLLLGVQSVMFDGSRLPDEDNVAATRAVVRECRSQGVAVEAELGEVGGKAGSSAHAPGVRTDPTQAAEFVRSTGVDALAVAVGSSHAMTRRDTVLDEDLIQRLRAAVPVPLVLHGSSGVDDAGIRSAVRAGMTKINVSTHLNTRFTAGLRRHLADHPDVVDPRRYLARAREEMSEAVTHLLSVIAG
ncbi:class II fructose-bisphosphate aldolase [Serinicoccus sp. LYQ131]|uniref:class II fructose-bisphosphate aldolase n=1 Tax=Serinicoccus sp. LYQ131 TaxID=3378797 RepID=UPI003854989C